MITRRSVLAGAAGVAGTVLFGGTAQAEACGADVELRARPDLAVTVRSRAGWGANENHRFDSAGKEIWPAEFYRVQAVTVHHAGYDAGNDPVAAVRDIYYNHAVTSGYGDIGYHLLIDWNGVAYEGRYSGPDSVPAANPTRLPATGSEPNARATSCTHNCPASARTRRSCSESGLEVAEVDGARVVGADSVVGPCGAPPGGLFGGLDAVDSDLDAGRVGDVEQVHQ